MKKIFILTATLLLSSMLFAQTSGTATLTITTVSNGGQYDPENIVAIWIETPGGSFIRSMKVMAAQRIQHLYKWKIASSMNTVGATTGATIATHQTHVIAWNCTDQSGSLLSDGDYHFWVEYTADDAQGPYSDYSFTKGPTAQSLTFPNETGFSNISLEWVPDPSGIEDEIFEASVKYNANGIFTFAVPNIRAENAFIEVFSINGEKIFSSYDYLDNGANRYFIWNSGSAASGLYIYRIESGADVYGGKIFK
ncbi:MAG: DUF2271 domain-containing protein [Bacteroidales bacterium]|nr:DUF2271 domain-containing protein [Bacteroidales bacterium]